MGGRGPCVANHRDVHSKERNVDRWRAPVARVPLASMMGPIKGAVAESLSLFAPRGSAAALLCRHREAGSHGGREDCHPRSVCSQMDSTGGQGATTGDRINLSPETS